ncbi:MAG: SDR family oxidoreductase [Rhodospirillales bacterium]
MPRKPAKKPHALPTIGPNFRLDGRRALVTGATRGLGLEIARALAQAGAQVFINGRKADAVKQQVQALNKAGLKVEGLAFDVTDAAATERAFAKIENGTGGIDILVNNVGVRDRRGLDALDTKDFNTLLQSDVIAAYGTCRLAAPGMRARKFGRIINVTSIIAELARPGDPAYISAKAGLAGLTRALAADLGPHGITVNAISPGFFATETNKPMIANPKIGPVYAARVPLGRWAEPQEIAGAAVFLASAAGSYVNGHILVVDGGVSATYGMV